MEMVLKKLTFVLNKHELEFFLTRSSETALVSILYYDIPFLQPLLLLEKLIPGKKNL
jgi:hypothetical protein